MDAPTDRRKQLREAIGARLEIGWSDPEGILHSLAQLPQLEE